MYTGEVPLHKGPASLFLPSIISFYLNFLLHFQLKKELQVDQDTIFQGKQMLN